MDEKNYDPLPQASNPAPPKSPSIFSGMNKFLIIILVIFALITFGLAGYLYLGNKSTQTTSVSPDTNESNTSTDSETTNPYYNEYFFSNLKKTIIPNKDSEQLITVKHKLIKIISLDTNNGLTIEGQQIEEEDAGRITIVYSSGALKNATFWDFTTENRQATSIDSLKVDQKIWITESVDVKQNSYETALKSVMVEIVN